MTIEENVLLAPHTTFHVGGPARYFALASSPQEVADAFDFAEGCGVPVFVLGAGSNLLVGDNGFPGLVVKLSFDEINVRDDKDSMLFTADAGLSWDVFVEKVVHEGCVGAENLSLIPGTIGGAIVQNIGAYGVEVSDFTESVEVYDVAARSVRTLTKSECAFGYRESIFKHAGNNLVVLRATFRLSKVALPNIAYKDITEYFRTEKIVTPTARDVRGAVMHVRTAKFPVAKDYGTAGSFFKNPVVSRVLGETILTKYPDAVHTRIDTEHIKFSAAWIIDHVLHMRGVREGNVGCAETQALVVVNYGGATCNDIKNFVSKIEKKCLDMINIQLEREVIFVGD